MFSQVLPAHFVVILFADAPVLELVAAGEVSSAVPRVEAGVSGGHDAVRGLERTHL